MPSKGAQVGEESIAKDHISDPVGKVALSPTAVSQAATGKANTATVPAEAGSGHSPSQPSDGAVAALEATRAAISADEKHVNETRVVVCGNVDAGKSTLLGVLTKGGLDDGRGKMRANVFRHKHEIESGRTSSVGTELMGFDENDHCVNYDLRKAEWHELMQRSKRAVVFYDLAGHEKYCQWLLMRRPLLPFPAHTHKTMCNTVQTMFNTALFFRSPLHMHKPSAIAPDRSIARSNPQTPSETVCFRNGPHHI